LKDQRKTEIKVGIVSIMAIITILLIIGWAKNYSINSTRRNVVVSFETVSGLESGAGVYVNGVKQGFVEKIENKNNGTFVTITLEKTAELKQDAEFHITMLDLMGGKKIEVKSGVADSEFDWLKVHKGYFDGDVQSVISIITSLKGEIPAMLTKLSNTLESVDKVIGDKQLLSDLKASLVNVKEVTSKLKTVVELNEESIRKITSNTEEITGDVKNLVKDNKNNIKNTFEQIDKLILKADKTLTRIDDIVTETKDKKNNAGKLLYDEKIAEDTKATLEQIKELTKMLVEQLKKSGIKIDIF